MTDPKKQLFFILIVALAAFCLYAAVRFLTEDDPARIRRGIYAAVLGLEQKDRARYGRIISRAYQDDQGNNKLTLLKVLEDALLDFEPVKCDVKQLTIEMKPDARAQVMVGYKFYFKNTRDQKLYYDAGRVTAHFIKEGRSWNIEKLDRVDAREIYSIQSVS